MIREEPIKVKQPNTTAEPLSNHLKIGIVGTTNIGKSTLFNCLSKAKLITSPVENELFTTIDPYITIFQPYDERLEYIKTRNPTIVNIKPSQFTVIDTAGLVEGSVREKNGVGASSYDQLGYCDVLLHLIKGFESEEVSQYQEIFHPLQQVQMLEQELIQMDLAKVENKLVELEQFMQDDTPAEHLFYLHEFYTKLWEFLAGEKRPNPPRRTAKSKFKTQYRTKFPNYCTGTLLRLGAWEYREREIIGTMKLLTWKEMLYLYNTNAFIYNRHAPVQPITYTAIQNMLFNRGDYAKLFMISCELEQNMFTYEHDGRLEEYQSVNATHASAVPIIIHQIHDALQIIHFYVITENASQEHLVMKDTTDRAQIKVYQIRQGKSIIEAAEMVDVKVARNFLRADVVAFDDYQKFEGDFLKLQMESKLRNEGRKYIVNDGDIIAFFENNTKYRKRH